MTPPPADYVVSLIRPDKAPQAAWDAFLQFLRVELKAAGLVVVSEEDDAILDANKQAWTVVGDKARMLAEADHMQLLKMKKGVDGITNGPRTEIFTVLTADEFEGYGTSSFWDPSERATLVRSLLDHAPAYPSAARVITAVCGQEVEIKPGQHTLLRLLQRLEIVETVIPLHLHQAARSLCWKVAKSTPATGGLPVDEIKDYYGSEVCLYFAWMDYFTTAAIVPGAVGLALWFFRPAGVTVDDSPLIPFFSLMMVVWSILFVTFWDRTASALACRWGTLDLDRKDEVRLEYWGTKSKSPVTGQPEMYFSSLARIPRYLLSLVVTSGMLAVAFGVMVCSLNLQGYVHKNSFVHISQLAQYAEAGRIFDPNAEFWYPSLVPVICHTIIITIINGQYRAVAEQLTTWENHRTVHAHENALIIKRFLFEAFDCYIALFYIAFYELDIEKLRAELVSLYTADSIRRLVTESVLPLVLQRVSGYYKSRAAKKAVGIGKKTDGGKAKPDADGLQEELSRDEYESFDDWLEMVLEFGYITLFASAFPLAAALSVVCNLIEVRSDIFKLTFVAQRPRAMRARDIGTWGAVLKCMAWLSIVTNVYLFGFTSDQIVQWFPSLFKRGSAMDGEDFTTAAGKGRFVVGIVFGIEHALVAVALLVVALVPSQPKWVRNDVARREFEKAEALREARAQRHSEVAASHGEKKA